MADKSRGTFQMRADPRDVARWKRQAKGAGMSLSEAVRRALDAYFAGGNRAVGRDGRDGSRAVTGGSSEARDPVAALRASVPGLRRASEVGGAEPEPEMDSAEAIRALPKRVVREVRATVAAHGELEVSEIESRLEGVYAPEYRAGVRALVRRVVEGGA